MRYSAIMDSKSEIGFEMLQMIERWLNELSKRADGLIRRTI